MISEPDYSNYTLEELYAALANWWRTKLDAQKVIRQIEKLIEDKEHANE